MCRLKTFLDTLLGMTTDGVQKCIVKIILVAFYDRSQGRANIRKSTIGNIISCHKSVNSVER